jgi:hypothetical protein
MRLAVIADTYPPLRISGAVQMRDLVSEMVVQGHEPTVIVPGASLSEPWIVTRSEDGPTILRVRTPPTKDISYARRTLNELRLPYFLLDALAASGIGTKGWDGVVWYSPTIFLAPIVKVIRRESRCPSYLILRDIFPEWAVDMGLLRRGLAYHFFKWIERAQYAVADTIGVQTEGNLPYINACGLRADQSVEVLHNWLSPSPNIGCSLDISRSPLAGRTIFVYAGNMGIAQGMDVFLEMVAAMRRRSDVGFVFVGRGSEAARFRSHALQQRLDNVLFFDEIDPAEIPGLLAQCQFGMLALDTRHSSHNIPGKFLTYMQSGLPVLARINPGNDLASVIRSQGVGKVCTAGDAALLCSLAEELLNDPTMRTTAPEICRMLWQRQFSAPTAVLQVAAAMKSKGDSAF